MGTDVRGQFGGDADRAVEAHGGLGAQRGLDVARGRDAGLQGLALHVGLADGGPALGPGEGAADAEVALEVLFHVYGDPAVRGHLDVARHVQVDDDGDRTDLDHRVGMQFREGDAQGLSAARCRRPALQGPLGSPVAGQAEEGAAGCGARTGAAGAAGAVVREGHLGGQLDEPLDGGGSRRSRGAVRSLSRGDRRAHVDTEAAERECGALGSEVEVAGLRPGDLDALEERVDLDGRRVDGDGAVGLAVA